MAKRDRHLLALESEEEEWKIERERRAQEEKEASRAVVGTGLGQRLSGKHNDGCIWPILRTFILAPLLWFLIIFLLKSCFGE